jgi:hypothetical protein
MPDPPQEITGGNTLLRLKKIIPTLEQQERSFLRKNPGLNQNLPEYSKITNSTSPTTSDSVVSKIQTTIATVSNKQIAYQQAIADYNQAVNSSKSDAIKYERIAGAMYAPIVSGVPPTRAENEDMCKASCTPANGCTGATYTPASGSNMGTCLLVNGSGSLSRNPSQNSVVFLNTLYYNLINLQQKNSALIDILDDVNVTIDRHPTLMKDYLNLLKNTSNGVNMSYETLLLQRDQISSLLDQYKFLDTNVKDAVIGINQSQMVYRFFVIILLLLVFFICVIKFDIKLDPVNWIGLGLGLSFVVYVFGMFTISAMIALVVILYVILR